MLAAGVAVTAAFASCSHDDHITSGGDIAAVEAAEFCFGTSVRAEITVFSGVAHIPGTFSAMGADLDFRLKHETCKDG